MPDLLNAAQSFRHSASGLMKLVKGRTSTTPELNPAVQSFMRKLSMLRKELQSQAGRDRRIGATIQTLMRLERRLQRPYRIAITGEFNTGKSSIANLLMRSPMLPTRAVSNTHIPTLMRFGGHPEIHAICNNGDNHALIGNEFPPLDEVKRFEVSLPLEPLRTIEVADLPGLADPLLHDRSISLMHLGVDAALWCTLGTQAWKESERASWMEVPEHVRKHGLLVVTNKDMLSERDFERVRARLDQEARPYFHSIVFLTPPQALDALKRKQSGKQESELWHESGGAAFEDSIATLTQAIAKYRISKIASLAEQAAERGLQRLQ